MSGECILVIDDSKEIVRHLTERVLPTFGRATKYNNFCHLLPLGITERWGTLRFPTPMRYAVRYTVGAAATAASSAVISARNCEAQTGVIWSR